jgi:hypothetical protein
MISARQSVGDVASSRYKRMLANFDDARGIEMNPLADGRQVDEQVPIGVASFCYNNKKMHLIWRACCPARN